MISAPYQRLPKHTHWHTKQSKLTLARPCQFFAVPLDHRRSRFRPKQRGIPSPHASDTEATDQSDVDMASSFIASLSTSHAAKHRRDSPMQLCQHTLESTVAGAGVGDRILESGLTYTSDKQFACRHAQNELLSAAGLAARCSAGLIQKDQAKKNIGAPGSRVYGRASSASSARRASS